MHHVFFNNTLVHLYFDIFGEVSYENRIINAVKLIKATGTDLTDEEEAYILANVP